jgi:hypothetical protein
MAKNGPPFVIAFENRRAGRQLWLMVQGLRRVWTGFARFAFAALQHEACAYAVAQTRRKASRQTAGSAALPPMKKARQRQLVS